MNRDRNTLKGFFTKGTIPSQENFADLIDSAINQNDDGISKLPNDPLRIDASGPDGTVLNFYQNVTDTKPAWALNLISHDPADLKTAKLGWNVSDGKGNTRLFIDGSSGNVGIGTISPAGKLDIQSAPRTGNHPTGAPLYVTGDISPSSGGIEFRHSNGSQGIGFGYNSIYATGSNSDQHLNLIPKGNGNVGVGTVNPQDALDVAGTVRILTGSNPIRFTSAWSGFADSVKTPNNHAEIVNDTDAFKTLMIVGNTSAGGVRWIGGVERRVGVWDRLDVNGELFQHVPMIQVAGNGNWKDPNHPMRIYFREKLTGQPRGTILQAMGDHPGWANLYWIGWVGSDGLVKISWTSNSEVTNN
jgi:hypothetical protein